MILSALQIAQYAVAAGFRGAALATAVAVALAESSGDPGAISPTHDYGLWQVNLAAHPDYAQSVLLTPDGSAHAAYAISDGGADWSPWTTFTSGRYLAFLSQAQQAAAQATATPGVPATVAGASGGAGLSLPPWLPWAGLAIALLVAVG